MLKSTLYSGKLDRLILHQYQNSKANCMQFESPLQIFCEKDGILLTIINVIQSHPDLLFNPLGCARSSWAIFASNYLPKKYIQVKCLNYERKKTLFIAIF